LAGKTLAAAISKYGASVKPKLAGIAIEGAPEDQLRGPLETLIQNLAEIAGLPGGSVHLVGELADIKTRPDFAVTVSKVTSVRHPRSTPSSPTIGCPNTQPI
jgi:hypothetical protein